MQEYGFWCKLEFGGNFGEGGGLLEGTVMQYVLDMRMLPGNALEVRVDLSSGMERGDSLGFGLSWSWDQGTMAIWEEVGGCKEGGVVPRAPHLKQDKNCLMRKITCQMTYQLDTNICIIKAC